ncbi:hypothetical protein FQN53_004216 [Emmonsiellopsis sp. PD_33]|nr:hypothetical protein FQN53_004216 [Emmonsiellopsis sp. PD_33]
MAGGDTATAIGVQADPQIPHWEEGKYISWMAANAGCDNFEQGYIREWLEDCLFQKGPDLAQYKRDAEILREEILSKFINLATCLDGCRWSKNKGLLAPGESDIPAKKQPKRSSSHRISFYHSEAYQTGHLILNDMNHQSSPNHE